MSEDGPSLKDILIRVLQSKKSSASVIVATAELIAADALFITRIAELKVSRKTFDADLFLSVLDKYDDLDERCAAAVENFEMDGDRDRLERVFVAVRLQLNQEPMTTLDANAEQGE